MENQKLKDLIQRIKSGNFQQLQSFFFVIDELEESFLTNYHKRKKEGVYYTTKEISKFIVTEALLLLINKKLRKNDTNLIQIQKIDEIFNLNSETKQKICKTLFNTTICDPACGSGIFLLNSVDLIFDIIKRLEPSRDKFEIKKKVA